MDLNSDFARRAVMHGARLDWMASPIAGIERRMLDRVGGEVARATTIVRYAPASQFLPQVHTGRGEFLVLEGGFQEAGEVFDAQSWLRLPVGAQLAATAGPRGCTVWVKTGHLAHPLTIPAAARS